MQREAEEETVVIKQREEEDALLAAKIANESRNRFVFKKDGGYLKEHKNGIDRFVKKDKISIPDRSASSSSSSSSPPRQAPVPNTSSSSSSSPCKAKNRTINGQESCTLGNTIQPESKPFNSSVRLSSMAGTAVNSLNKRNKPPATSQASSHAPKNGIPSFFVKGPISAVRGSLRAHSATGRDPVCGEHRIFLDRDFHDLVSDDDDDDSCPATDTAESRYADNVQGRCGGRGGDKKSERRRHEIIEIDVDTGQKRGRERERETDQQDGVGVGVGEGSWKIPSIESRTGAHAMNRQVRRGLGSHSENQIDHGQASHLVNRAPVTERRCPQNAQALPPPATWSCTACTYKNLSPLTTCEICDTTKSH